MSIKDMHRTEIIPYGRNVNGASIAVDTNRIYRNLVFFLDYDILQVKP